LKDIWRFTGGFWGRGRSSRWQWQEEEVAGSRWQWQEEEVAGGRKRQWQEEEVAGAVAVGRSRW